MVVFFSLQSKSQSDFRDGYIVKNNKDTLYGLIDYSGNIINDKKCTFKKEINAEKQVFSPDEILFFRFINSKCYVSKKIEVDGVETATFLEFIIKGKIDIYYHNRLDKYYLQKDDQIYELKNSKGQISDTNGYMYEQEKKEYIGLMRYLFQDAAIQASINKTVLNHKSLIKFVKEYTKLVCSDNECVVYEKKISKEKSTFGIVAGLNGMSIAQNGGFSDELYYLKDSHFGVEVYPSIGVYYKAKMPGLNERLYIQYEAAYSHVSLATSNTYYEPVYSTTFYNDIHLKQNTFNNLLLLKYVFPKRKIRPTLQLGAFANYSFTSSYTKKLEAINASGKPVNTNQPSDNPFSKLDYGINCGFGFLYQFQNNKEIFFDIRYQRGFGLLKGLNTNTFMMNVGFQIGK